jgi:hypothetical protein
MAERRTEKPLPQPIADKLADHRQKREHVHQAIIGPSLTKIQPREFRFLEMGSGKR